MGLSLPAELSLLSTLAMGMGGSVQGPVQSMPGLSHLSNAADHAAQAERVEEEFQAFMAAEGHEV